MSSAAEGEDTLFATLQDNIDGSTGTAVESLCMNCHEQGITTQGITRILLTKIPFFKEVVIMAFECEKCGFRSNELQPGGQIAQLGVHITCKVDSRADLQRSILLSDYAVVTIPEVELVIPSSRKGRLTTVEGVLSEVMENLNMNNEGLRKIDPEGAAKVAAFVARLAMLIAGVEEFHLDIRDPSGNSAIEGLELGKRDLKVTKEEFKRSPEENRALGLQDAHQEPEEETEPEGEAEPEGETDKAETQGGQGEAPVADENGANDELAPDEVMVLEEECPACANLGQNRMKVQTIPFFKEVILMAFSCDFCGYKSTEVKPGGQISEKGRKTILNITTVEDLSRDMLKSDTAILDVPEIELSLEAGTLGSVFTTIEGMLLKVKENIMGSNPFALGDSAAEDSKNKFAEFFESLDRLVAGEQPFTVILDDPAGNSFIQNFYAPDPDPEMTVEEYERDEEQDAELGLATPTF